MPQRVKSPRLTARLWGGVRVLHQQLRVGGLALATTVATATLALVTFLVSNLVLTVVAGLGGIATEPRAEADPRGPVQGVLLSAQSDEDRDHACRRAGVT